LNNRSNGHVTGAEKDLRLPVDLEGELSKLEKAYLLKALDQAYGIKKNAAQLLGLNFRSFRYRLKKYGFSDCADGIESSGDEAH
jgi:two-component system, NtrC family, response regulator PilR